MRKLYIAVAAFAAFMFSHIAHAIPTVEGATDIATDDGSTYYALQARDGGWHVDGYTAGGASTGFSIQLNPNQYVNPTQQVMVGLAFDGTNFYALRNDLVSRRGTNTWSVHAFDTSGQWTGESIILGPSVYVNPTNQKFVAFDVADEGFVALRDESVSMADTDAWRVVGFDQETGAYNGFNTVLDGAPSDTPYLVMAGFNNSPVRLEASTNQMSVPEPGTGLLLGSMLALGLMGRKRLATA